MATNYVSGRTARRLRLTLAKRIADVTSELGDECKRHCRGIRYDKANDDDELEAGRSVNEGSKDSGGVLGIGLPCCDSTMYTI